MSQADAPPPAPSLGQAHTDPYSIPLDQIDVSDSEIFEADTHWGYFERLRKEDPVHYCAASEFGPYWSVTRFDDIVTVEKDPETFSSARSIVVGDPDPTSISRPASSPWTGRGTWRTARPSSRSSRLAT